MSMIYRKLSNKGQSLVLFICVIPIMFLLFACFINIGYLSYLSNNINSINYNTISYGINHLNNDTYNNLKKILKENNINEDSYKLEVDLDKKMINLTINHDANFIYKTLFNDDNIKSSYNAKIDNNKVIIERVK